MNKTLLASPLLVLLGACSSGGTSSTADAPATSAPTAASSSSPPSPSGRPSDGPYAGQPDASGTAACVEVRAGIDAFNRGDLTGTVAHFSKAVPLARAQADDSQGAADLVEAVEYYAALPPQRYPKAALRSPAFARYKTITLGQCVAASTTPLQSPSASDSGGTST